MEEQTIVILVVWGCFALGLLTSIFGDWIFRNHRLWDKWVARLCFLSIFAHYISSVCLLC
jgi:hypothetical protein